MANENKSYRIRTKVGCDEEPVVHIDMTQSFDKFEILSLTLNQTNNYSKLSSDYGIIVGRVLANGGFGIPNAKISVFVKYEETGDMYKRLLYRYSSTKSKNDDGIRYNLLPSELNDECHQNIGTFPTKRMVLDNDTWIDVFDKYYKYTTKTNNAGDYMIYGVPVGSQTVHVDIDMSDIGVLSQRPRDMIYQGADVNLFESPNKFRKDTNLDYLKQVFTQDKVIYVYPFWGDTTENELGAAITRCDIDIDYKFEPTCVFMGSVMTDTGENALSKKCIAQKDQGKMSEMITGQGTIEMIRKTPDGYVEQYSVMGNQVIDTDGVWCYQIPMNLDYVITDEYGNTVLSDDPNKGIATRTRVRFRIGMSDTGTEATARKRAKFLVPNNPRWVEEDYPKFCESDGIVDYEFGTKTREEDFRDLFWNKVYTVKSYIPRLQKSRLPNNKRRTGIKMVNHSGANNPMPFNGLGIKFNFTYMFLCALLKVLVWIVYGINSVLTTIAYVLYTIGDSIYTIGDKFDDIGDDLYDIKIAGWHPLRGVAQPFWWLGEVFHKLGCWFMGSLAIGGIGNGIELSGLCVDDDGNEKTYNPGVINRWRGKRQRCDVTKEAANTNLSELFNCVENQLAQENEVTSFNFENDWVNGVLYLPLWYRKIKPKKKYFFGLITISAKDQWCDSNNKVTTSKKAKKHLKLYRTCAQTMKVGGKTSTNPMGTIEPLSNVEKVKNAGSSPDTGIEYINFTSKDENNCYGFDCHKSARTYNPIDKGLIVKKETMLGDEVYYYKPIEKNEYNTDLVTLFATDLVLLGSLNECDLNGIPQFFKALESTTYNMPPDLLVEDFEYNSAITDDSDDSTNISLNSRSTENTGADWGNLGVDQSKGYNEANTTVKDNGGLFYGLTCFNSYTKPKSCINLSRICEFGVGVDEAQSILKTSMASSAASMQNEDQFEDMHETLIPDGYVSYDEIYDMDYRSMFATLNGNFLKTKLNFENGLYEYDFNHLYIDNFDGVLSKIMNGQAVDATTEQSNYENKANYRNNYKLEKSSNDYLNFRFGDYKKKNNSKIYYYDYDEQIAKRSGKAIYANKRFPRYENSFYFYFGLNEGKTAIDKFRTNYFAPCNTDGEVGSQVEINYVPNEWCGTLTGYITFDTMLQAPLTLKVIDNRATNDNNSTYTVKGIAKQNFYIGAKNDTASQKYQYYLLTMNGDPYNTLPNGDYTIQITDSEDNVFEERLLFQGDFLDYKIDVHSFTLKNDDLAYIPGLPDIKDRYGALMWKELFTQVANYGQDKNLEHSEYYISSSRGIRGDTDVDISSLDNDNYYKLVLTPLNRSVFWYDFYRRIGSNDNYLYLSDGKMFASVGLLTQEQFNNDTFYIATGVGSDENTIFVEATTYDDMEEYYIYKHILYYNVPDYETEEDPDDMVSISFAYFNGTDEEYDDLNNILNTQYWTIMTEYDSSLTGELVIVNNYRGCDFTFRKYEDNNEVLIEIINNESSYVPIGADMDIGYLGYNKNFQTMYFGVPYGNQRYSIEITQLCLVNGEYVETENSVKNIFTVPEYNFKMFINNIDYDLIKNFRTGFDNEKTSTILDYTDSIRAIDNTKNPKFYENKMLGWNNLDNIGLDVQEWLVFRITDVIKPINYLTEVTNFNYVCDKIHRYLSVLNENYEWNGVQHYVPRVLSQSGSVSLFGNIDVSNPYTWSSEYCIPQITVNNYNTIVDNAANTVNRIITITTYNFVLKNSDEAFDSETGYYIKNNNKYNGPYTYPDIPEAQEYYYISGSTTDSYEETIIPIDLPSNVNYKQDTLFDKTFDINPEEEYDEDNGYPLINGNNNIEIVFTESPDIGMVKLNGQDVELVEKENGNFYALGILAAILNEDGSYTYYSYTTVNGYDCKVYYYSYSSKVDKILPIIYDINDIIVKRQEVANSLTAAFINKKMGNSLQITYKSNEPPIEYTCIGSTEINTEDDKIPENMIDK